MSLYQVNKTLIKVHLCIGYRLFQVDFKVPNQTYKDLKKDDITICDYKMIFLIIRNLL